MTSEDVKEDEDSVGHHDICRRHVCWWPAGMAGQVTIVESGH